MRGFKDDFYAWKDSLSKDEQALLLKQAQNEFDKKFRKSDEFSQDLPEEKIQSFAKVLKKFFDNAARPFFLAHQGFGAGFLSVVRETGGKTGVLIGIPVMSLMLEATSLNCYSSEVDAARQPVLRRRRTTRRRRGIFRPFLEPGCFVIFAVDVSLSS